MFLELLLQMSYGFLERHVSGFIRIEVWSAVLIPVSIQVSHPFSDLISVGSCGMIL